MGSLGNMKGQEPANKGQTYPVEVLSDAEVKSLIGACSRRSPSGIRNRALIVVMYRGGLRVSEALKLRPKDIDADLGTVRILNGKGGRSRVVGLDPEAFAVIERWLAVRAKNGINGRAPVFSTLQGRPLAPEYVRNFLKRMAEKASIEKRVHPHGLRHSHAAQLAQEGVPMNVIQAQLGHSNLATTSRYLAHVSPTAVIEAMQARKWEL